MGHLLVFSSGRKQPRRPGATPLVDQPVDRRLERSLAIYHLNAKTGSRRGGQSAGAKARYHRREGRYARGRLSPDQVVHATAGNMPRWAQKPTDYWDAADEHERTNGRLFKELEFALPRELDAGAQVELAAQFARELAGDDLPYQLVLHDDPDGENPHAHLMLSERVNDGLERDPATWFKRASNKDAAVGGARKTDRLKPRAWLEHTRKRWAEMANETLARAGQPDRIDHRSLVAQGIKRFPGRHLGPHAAAAEAAGLRTWRGELNRARQYAIVHPDDEVVRSAYDRALEHQRVRVRVRSGVVEPRAPHDYERRALELDEQENKRKIEQAQAQTALEDTPRYHVRARKRIAQSLKHSGEQIKDLQQRLHRLRAHAETMRKRLRADAGAVRRAAAAADESIVRHRARVSASPAPHERVQAIDTTRARTHGSEQDLGTHGPESDGDHDAPRM